MKEFIKGANPYMPLWEHVPEGRLQETVDLDVAVIGKHAVYFEFLSKEEGAIAEFDRFTFV